ncbi:hypothetical protein TIFTF001_025689 [Ficus carica]|uniref:Uncharacterized protein n=1 Tax=Ficus carica TaxID=3494 RepID=A0AA88DFR2_FICCA|nr:hypothetical protein TIFTF001_025689 [Ficus carica]
MGLQTIKKKSIPPLCLTDADGDSSPRQKTQICSDAPSVAEICARKPRYLSPCHRSPDPRRAPSVARTLPPSRFPLCLGRRCLGGGEDFAAVRCRRHGDGRLSCRWVVGGCELAHRGLHRSGAKGGGKANFLDPSLMSFAPRPPQAIAAVNHPFLVDS